MIGKTFSEEEINRINFTQENEPHNIRLVTSEIKCYIAESKPTGNGSKSFPEQVY